MMTVKSHPTFADQDALMSSLYLISGLVDAIQAIRKADVPDAVLAGALTGTQRAIEREIDALLEAAERKEIIVRTEIERA